MRPDLGRRLLAEAVGSCLLAAGVVGSGIAASRLSPDDAGLQLLENAAATVGILVALILALGPVSGAHFNPVVTLADRAFGGLDTVSAAAYAAAQVFGCAAGAVLANLMFDVPAVELSTTDRITGATGLAEVVATFGLVLVIFGVVRSRRTSAAPFAVGAYIGAAYFFTSSTSFANPAITLGRTLSDTFAGIAPASAPAFITAQLVGGALAIACARALYPDLADVAADVVVPPARPAGGTAMPEDRP